MSEKNEDHINETDDMVSDELSEEDLNELVLQAQREFLLQQKEETPPEKRIPKGFIWLLATTLFLSTFAGLFQVFSIPAIEFLKTSASYLKRKTLRHIKNRLLSS